MAGTTRCRNRIVDLDSAALVRLREHHVIERCDSLIAGFVSREHLHRRVERLVEQQREEGDAQRRIAGDSRAAAG